MNIAMVRDALLWCTVINFGFLAIWSLLFVLTPERLHQLLSKWLRLSVEQFDAINFGAIVLYKTAIILFALTPYVALRIVA